MAGPLGVTQLLLFSRNTESGNTTLRIARCPRGPTLHFRVTKYSLCKDIRRSMKRPKTPTAKEYLSPPLLVMNNFTTPSAPGEAPGRQAPHEALIVSMFQSLFPALSAQHTPVSSIRRVLLLNRIPKASAANLPKDERSDSDYLIDLRHYSITTKPLGLSKAIKRLNAAEKVISSGSIGRGGTKVKGGKGTVPNLGKLEDISEYMLDPSLATSGYTSESEVEEDAEVEVLPGSTSVKNPTKRKRTSAAPGGGAEKHAVKLSEIGPRMTLELVKIEEGLGDGKVLYHSFVSKTKKEEKELDERWKERKKIKEERRKEQEANVKKKKDAKEEARSKRKAGKQSGQAADEKSKDSSSDSDSDSEDDDKIIDYVKSESEEENDDDNDDDMWDDEEEAEEVEVMDEGED